LVLAAAEKNPRFKNKTTRRIFNSPCCETPKNAIKKIEQNNRGRKKNRGKNPHIFCDEPRWIFVKIFLCVFLNPPCYETPKNAIKNIDEK
jgi:hypothetical protein